jgi:hypothetical protein
MRATYLRGLAHLTIWLGVALCHGRVASQELPARLAPPVDASTLHHKVLCGYQGWFRCPGDGAEQGWRHWCRDARRISPQNLTIEMWPDMSEYTDEEKFAAPGFTYPDGSASQLFSSTHPRTVQRHFEWMQESGIDSVMLQRFLVEMGHPAHERVLANVRASAANTGRAYAICYDLSGQRPERIVESLTRDWKRLVDEQHVTQDKQYLHHNSKPVLFVWGFYSDRFDAAIAHELIDFLKSDEKYGVTLIGGCPWSWRQERHPEWAKVYRRFDVISPWNVGNVTKIDGQKQASTGFWKDDLKVAQQCGMEYLPVIYPGFGWTNLKGPSSATATIPRLKGEFFWKQFVAAKQLNLTMAYVAMFDEVDEGTAIFKVSNSPPTQANFLTLEGMPTDWYLRLTAAGAKLLRGELESTTEIPIQP